MASEFDWKESVRIAVGAILIGVGIVLIGKSGGKTSLLIVGIIFIGLGLALIVG